MIDEDIESIEEGLDENENSKKKTPKKPFFDSRSKTVQNFLLEILKALIVIFITIIIILLFFNKKSIVTLYEEIETSYKNQDIVNVIPEGQEWEMNEMIINTADTEHPHFVRIKLVVSYEKNNLEFLRILKVRKNQIYNEVRKLIASKTYNYLKVVDNQESLRMEIKKEIQLIVRKQGLIEVFIVNFTLH